VEKQKAIFLDRDGVINALVYYKEQGIIDSPFTPKQFVLLKGVPLALRKLRKAGFKLIIVSNQPGIAKKNFSFRTLNKINKKMIKLLEKGKASIDAIYYCYHHPQGKNKKYAKKCNCRKPSPGLLLKAAKDYNINLRKSYMIGDSWQDIMAAKKVGCKSIMVVDKYKSEIIKMLKEKNLKPDFFAINLLDAARKIEKRVI